MDLQTSVLRTYDDVAAVADAWQSLHETSAAANPFTGPDWALTWLGHFVDPSAGHGARAPHVVTVRDGDRLVGVAPLYRRPIAGGTVHAVQHIGTGNPWVGPYEVPALLAAPGLGRDVTRAVVQQLCQDTAEWDWVHLLPGDAAPWFEPEWLPDWTFTVVQRRSRANVVLDLSSGQDVYAGRRNLKESFRRARNRLTRDVGADGWSVTRVTDPCEVPTAFGRLADLHGARASLRSGRPVHADVLGDPAVRAFVREVVARSAVRKGASVYELRIGSDVVAAQLVLHTGTASYSSVSGITEAAWPYSAVTYLQSVAVQDALDAGHSLFNLSTGPNQAKLRWSDDVRTTTEFALVGPRRRSRLLHVGVEMHQALAGYREARRAHRV